MKQRATLLTLVFLLGSVAAGYVMFVAGKEVYRGRKIGQEIEKLKAEAEKVKFDNEDLREKIAYLDTDQFRERIAKEKLNLKKSGENVIEVRPPAVLGDETLAEESSLQLSDKNEELKNYEKWLNFFFSY